MAEIKYTELAKAKIQKSRNLVISATSKGGFTIAQQLEVNEGNRTTTVFLGKSGMIVDDLEGLYSVRDALNVAIDKMENKEVAEKDDEDWDE